MNDTTGWTRGLGRTDLWIIAMMAMLCASLASAQGHQVNLNDLLSETQQQSNAPDRLTMVWWIPAEFWEATLSQQKALTAEGVEKFLGVLEPYVLFGVVDGTIGPLGAPTFREPSDLRGAIELIDRKGVSYAPLPDDLVSADAKNLAAMMKPIVSNMLGPLGENVGFFFFPALTRDETPIAAAAGEGRFAVRVAEELFEWETPLGSLLPPKVCPVDGRSMSGAWRFCPWHGKELVSAP